MDYERVLTEVQALVEKWCDRRALKALRQILAGYPVISLLTDAWAELMVALQEFRAFAREEVRADELKTIDECIRRIENVVNVNQP